MGTEGIRAGTAGDPGPLLIFTIDTECSVVRQPNPNPDTLVDELIFGDFGGEGRPGGIGLQMDLLEQHGFRGCFFLDVLMELRYGQHAVERIVEAIAARGHEIQLHVHPEHFRAAGDPEVAGLGGATTIPDRDLFRRALEFSVELFEQRVGKRPSAYRAGGFRIADFHFPVLAEYGIGIDSSMHAYFNSRVSDWMRTRTQPFWVDGVLEVPPSVVMLGAGADEWQLRDLVPNPGVAEPVPWMPARPDGAPHVATYVSHSFELLQRRDSEDPSEIEAHVNRLLPVLPTDLANRFRWRPPKSVRTFGEEVDEEKAEAVADLLERVADRPGGRCITFEELAGLADRFWPADRQRTVDRMPSYDPPREQADAIPTRIYSRGFLGHLAKRARVATTDVDPPDRGAFDGLERGPAETLATRVAGRLEADGALNVRLRTLGVAPAATRGPLPPLAELLFPTAAVSAVASDVGIEWVELLPWDVATSCAWLEANGFEVGDLRRIERGAGDLAALEPHLEKLAWLDATELRTEAFEAELRRAASSGAEGALASTVLSFTSVAEDGQRVVAAPPEVDPARLPTDAAELYSSMRGGEELELRMPDCRGCASRTTILLALMRAGFEPVARAGNTYRLARPLELADITSIRGTGATNSVAGYAERLSWRTGERAVFHLDPIAPTGGELPVESIVGEGVGQVEIGPCDGGPDAPVEPWRNGFGLPARASFELEPSLPSGVYTLGGSVPFVHRGAGSAPIAVLLPSNTATAFNAAGGRRFYETDGRPPADVLSFQRPLPPPLLLARCGPFARWFAEANPHPRDTTYLIDSDLERPGALDGVEVLLVIGRSEYWTRKMRERFDAFVAGGGRALLLCSEIMYWQVRLDDSGQQLLRYKKDDPHPDPPLRTTVWQDPSLEYPVFPRTGCDLAHGGFAADDEGVGWGGMKIVTPDSPLLTGSGLAEGDVVRLPDASVWDGAPVEDRDDGALRVDFGEAPPWRHEAIAYNLVRPIGEDPPVERPATSLWLALRHAPASGTVVHCGTFGWCEPRGAGGHGPDSERIRAIILHMLTVLLEDEWPFSDPAPGEASNAR